MKTYIQTIIALILPFMSFAQEKGLDQRIDEAFKPFSNEWQLFSNKNLGDYYTPSSMIEMNLDVSVLSSLYLQFYERPTEVLSVFGP